MGYYEPLIIYRRGGGGGAADLRLNKVKFT